MVIDCHTHIGFKEPLIASPGELLESMKKAGIDATCVFAGELNGCPTEKLLEELSHLPHLYPIGSVSPLSPSPPSLAVVEEWLASGKIYGLKFYPGYEFYYPYDSCVRPYLELLVKYNKPAIFHSGDTYSKAQGAKLKYAHPFEIDELASELPDLKIIIAHFGNPWFRDTAEVCLKNKNVYSDCSGFVYGSFQERDKRMFAEALETFMDYSLVHVFGRTKLLFGTDWPISDQSDYMKCVSELFSTSQEREDFFVGNALEVFDIKNISNV
ncbi:amidohydrolase [Candidatus Uhrbacteria bacterium]|nr:amidohydrolase [Candidatus Uhrbacteria bacterium]